MNPKHSPSRAPQDYPRRILLLVTGRTPQVLTETLYALTQTGTPAWEPTEIHLLSTSTGVEDARLELLHPEQGWYYRLCEDYGLDKTSFGESGLHTIIRDDGSPAEDLREEQDHIAAADAITRLVQNFTADADAALHVSIAGGRKTMSFYAGYALSLLGRPQDRMSHVLVNAPYESNRDFFYPTPYSRKIYSRGPEGRAYDTRNARVMLADIPFVRLRGQLPARLRQEEHGFAALVQNANHGNHPPHLVVDEENGRLSCGGVRVELRDAEFALYAWFAFRAQQELEPIQRKDYPREYRGILKFYPDQDSGHLDNLWEQAQKGVSVTRFDTQLSRIRNTLIQTLGQQEAAIYGIHRWGGRPGRYGLDIAANHIHFTRIETP